MDKKGRYSNRREWGLKKGNERICRIGKSRKKRSMQEVLGKDRGVKESVEVKA